MFDVMNRLAVIWHDVNRLYAEENDNATERVAKRHDDYADEIENLHKTLDHHLRALNREPTLERLEQRWEQAVSYVGPSGLIDKAHRLWHTQASQTVQSHPHKLREMNSEALARFASKLGLQPMSADARLDLSTSGKVNEDGIKSGDEGKDGKGKEKKKSHKDKDKKKKKKHDEDEDSTQLLVRI
jgi:hypothetical protein